MVHTFFFAGRYNVLRGESNVAIMILVVPAIGGYGVEDIYLGGVFTSGSSLRLGPGAG